jgi:hypothetical protein
VKTSVLQILGLLKKNQNQFGHPHWEDDMTHNYTHGPYMINHLNLPTITFQKLKHFAHKE